MDQTKQSRHQAEPFTDTTKQSRYQVEQSKDQKRILVVGAGDFQVPLIRAAARRGQVIVAAPVVSDVVKSLVSEMLLVDVRDAAQILLFAQGKHAGSVVLAAGYTRRPVDAVITDQTDLAVRTVAYVAEQMGLPGIGSAAARLFSDKTLMRARMEEMGLPVLPHATVHSLDEACEAYATLGGTVIVKPVDCQGSRGVQICHNEQDIRDKFAEAARWSSADSAGEVLIERFASGREFVVEGLAINNSFYNLCIGDTFYFDLPDAFAANRRQFPTSAPDALRDRVLALNKRIVEGFGLSFGITHSEFILEGDEIYLIETAARGGGMFISSDLIPAACGLHTEDFLVGAALGEITDSAQVLWEKSSQTQHCAYIACYAPSGFVRSVQGVEQVQQLPFVHRTQLAGLSALEGKDHRETCSDKTSRYAITLSAASKEELESRVEQVRQLVHVVVETPEGTQADLIWE